MTHRPKTAARLRPAGWPSALRRRLALVSAIALLCTAGTAWGCGGVANETANGQAIEVTDDTGASLVLEEPAARVVSLAPSNTEIVFALGAQTQLVGVTTFCDYPEAAKSVDKIGTFFAPSIEAIVALEPDLVLAPGGKVQTGVQEELERLNVPVFVVSPESLAELLADIRKVGRLLGRNEEAASLTTSLGNDIRTVESRVASLPSKKVFFEIYSEPLITAGKSTLIDEIVTLAGGVNIGAAAGEGYPQFSAETLLEENPEVYIAVKGAQNDPGAIASRPGCSTLAAVVKGQVFVIDDNLVVRDGPRIVRGLLEVAKCIHPEAFAGVE